MARELGVCWDTVMEAVREHGQPLVDDPGRVGAVTALGVDETTFLRANRDHPTRYATGLVDLKQRIVIDVVEGNTSKDLGSWLDARPAQWLAGVGVVATDLAESYRSGLQGRLDHALRVADPFHVVRVANRCLDQALLARAERDHRPPRQKTQIRCIGSANSSSKAPNASTPRALTGCSLKRSWGTPTGTSSVRGARKSRSGTPSLTDSPTDAKLLLDKTIEGCRTDWVPEIRTLGETLERWRVEITNHHRTGASNGPTEGLNLLVKKVKRAGHGFRSFPNYRLRILLHAGGVNWPAQRPPTPTIRTRSPH
jgi:transposase